MRRSRADLALLGGAAVFCVVGIVDAARSDDPRLIWLFGLVLVVLAALVLRTPRGRSLIAVRADLTRWLERRAIVTGERPEELADRAVASYRDDLGDDDS